MKILLVGMSHRTAPLALRERLAVDDPAPPLRKLVASDEIDEAVLLSTCNRIEVVALTRNPDAARLRLRSFFRRELGGDDARPAAAELDALLSTSTAAPRPCATCCAWRRRSTRWWWASRRSSARPRTPTARPSSAAPAGRSSAACSSTPSPPRSACARRRAVAARPVSVARVAVDLAEQIFEELAGKRALLIGAGEMTEAALAALRERGLASVAIANRTPERAEPLAVRFGAHGARARRAAAPARRGRRRAHLDRRRRPAADAGPGRRPRSPAARAARSS